MNYARIHNHLLKIGRDNNFALVSDAFKPHLRQNPKFRQWQRLVEKTGLKAMSETEKQCLHDLLFIKALNLKQSATTQDVVIR